MITSRKLKKGNWVSFLTTLKRYAVTTILTVPQGGAIVPPYCFGHRYSRKIPDLVYHSGVVSHRAQIGGLWVFADNTRRKKMRPQSSRAVQHFMCVCLHPQTAVDAGDIRTQHPQLFWLKWEKPEDPQSEPHAGIKWHKNHANYVLHNNINAWVIWGHMKKAARTEWNCLPSRPTKQKIRRYKKFPPCVTIKWHKWTFLNEPDG